MSKNSLNFRSRIYFHLLPEQEETAFQLVMECTVVAVGNCHLAYGGNKYVVYVSICILQLLKFYLAYLAATLPEGYASVTSGII
jgi:hypothetical protein